MLIPTSGRAGKGEGEKVEGEGEMHGLCWAGKNSADHQSCITITHARPSLMEVSFLKSFLRVRSQVHLKVLCPVLHRLRQEPGLSILQRCLRSSCCRCSISCFPFLLGLLRCICGTAVALSRGSSVCPCVRSQRRVQEMLVYLQGVADPSSGISGRKLTPENLGKKCEPGTCLHT